MFKKLLAVAVISAFFGSASVFAEEAKKPLTLDDAVTIAQKAYPNSKVGKKEKERGLFEVYLTTEAGEKITVKIDPKTGDIVSPKQKKEEPAQEKK